jgi:hypothetical protein
VKARKIVILCAVAALFSGWLIYVFSFNARIKSLEEIPTEDYGLGEFVSFAGNYAYGQALDGFQIRADGYKIWDTAEFLALYSLTMDDISYAPEKICVVDVVICYDGDEQAAIDPTLFYMFGTDYYEGQNDELYALANPKSGGATGIIFHAGDECAVSLVYNLQKDYYTAHCWKHVEDLPRKIYLTANPVQKNIVLHD